MNDLHTIANVLFEPDDIIEIRGIKGKRPNSQIKQLWTRAAELPFKADELGAMNLQGWNIYFGVNPRSRLGGTKKEDVALARCVFADFDDKDNPLLCPGDGCGRYEFIIERIIEVGLPEPDLVVSSGNGLHTYWRLDEPIYDAGEFRAAQQNIIDLLQTDDVKDFPRIMRLPPFMNVKEQPKDCFVLYPMRSAW